jgi:hypothetical protein
MVGAQVHAPHPPIEIIAQPVDHGRIGLQSHADFQPAHEHAGHLGPLACLAGFALDDGGQYQQVFRRSAAARASAKPRPRTRLAVHGLVSALTGWPGRRCRARRNRFRAESGPRRNSRRSPVGHQLGFIVKLARKRTNPRIVLKPLAQAARVQPSTMVKRWLRTSPARSGQSINSATVVAGSTRYSPAAVAAHAVGPAAPVPVGWSGPGSRVDGPGWRNWCPAPATAPSGHPD